MPNKSSSAGEGPSTSRKEALAQQLGTYYNVNSKVAHAVLEMNKWDVGKCVKVLPLLSNKPVVKPNSGKKDDKMTSDKKVLKASNDKKDVTKKGDVKNKEAGKGDVKNKEAGKGDKLKQNQAGKVVKLKVEKSTAKQGDVKKTKAMKNNEPCVLNLPRNISKTTTVLKNVPACLIKSTACQSTFAGSPFQPLPMQGKAGPSGLAPSDSPAVSDLLKDKKVRRKELKACYDIIKQKGDVMDRTHDYIKANIRLLVLMRGCPGSGKSTCARELLSKSGIFNFEDHIFSTDNYFIQESGEYVYKVEELAAAHSWNQELVQRVMKTGLSPIIVDNTHVRVWEMQFFAKCAVKFGYIIETMEARTPWFFNEKVLACKNTHGVPKLKIEQMLSNYEANISGDKLLEINELTYNVAQAPPQSVFYDKKTVKELIIKLKVCKSQLSNKTVKNQLVPPKNLSSQVLIDFNVPEVPPKAVKDNLSVFDLLINDNCGLGDVPLIPVTQNQGLLSDSMTVLQGRNVEEASNDGVPVLMKSGEEETVPKEEQFDDKINKLRELFPDFAIERLSDALQKCGANLLAAIGTLLEESNVVSQPIAPSAPPQSSQSDDLQRLGQLFPTVASSVIQSIYATTEDFDKSVGVLRIVDDHSNSAESKEQTLNSDFTVSTSESVVQEFSDSFNDLASSTSADDSIDGSEQNDQSGASSSDESEAQNDQSENIKPDSGLVSRTSSISLETFRNAMDNILGSLEKTSLGVNAVVENACEEGEDAITTWQNTGELPQSDTPKDQREHRRDSATNTNYLDFDNLKQASKGNNIDNIVLTGRPNFISGTCTQRADSSVFSLDKSTTTISADSPPRADGITVLKGMFPYQPEADLKELLDSCLGDVDWAVGLLLDSGLDVSTNFVPPEETFLPHNSSEPPIDPAPVSPPSQPPPVAKRRKKTTIAVSDIGLNFVMNEESDSDHLRRIRNLRYGRSEPIEDPSLEEDIQSAELDEEITPNDEGDIALPLSSDFILNLQDFFGSFIPPLREDKIMVKVPVGLARQLHTYIMDSVCQQYQEEEKLVSTIIAQDESLARQLQEEANGPQHPSLQEIMDKELALNLHRAFNKGDTGETMAGQLSRQLLIEKFPKLDPTALRTLLEDTDHSLYQATQLLEAAGYTPASQVNKGEEDNEGGLSREEAVSQASAYRETAKCLMDLRADCLSKANNAFHQGNKSVASYYSEMARWHNERIEQANLLASTLLLEGGNNTATTLDLHFMRVKEAVQVLDLFIDGHISRLGETGGRRQNVFVITGRGVHSVNGRARLRPVVANRLKQRSIPFNLVNPGLFMVTLSQKMSLSCHS